MTKKERKKEFLVSRTSWRFFTNRFARNDQQGSGWWVKESAFVLLEILKELQFMNDKSNA